MVEVGAAEAEAAGHNKSESSCVTFKKVKPQNTASAMISVPVSTLWPRKRKHMSRENKAFAVGDKPTFPAV